MYIEKLEIKNFRNYKETVIELDKNINIFYGDNAQGKTNLLESIYFLGIGRSYRTSNDKELIKFDKSIARVMAITNSNEIKDKVEIFISDSKNKTIFLNGLGIKKLGELLGAILIVSFSPEDLQLIKQGPSERRRFIDLEMCQISKIYYYDLKQYNHILKQRNKLLKKIRLNKNLQETLFAFDTQLVEYGIKIINYRKKYIENLSIYSNEIQKELTNNEEHLEIKYLPSTTVEEYEQKMTKNIDKDIIFGNTSIGVHKDDIGFYINKKNIKKYGSQGQQRTAVLSTKLALIKIIKERKNTNPILLLDDVLSELDKTRQQYLIQNIQNVQTIITTTGAEEFISKFKKEFKVFYIHKGKVSYKN